MLKNLPRQYNPPGHGKRDMERPIFADKMEEAMIRALFGPGKMTEHGIPSYSWRDNSSSDTRSSTSDSNGGIKSNASSGGGDSKGGNYTFSQTRAGNLGNWNTGGTPVATGNISGTRGLNPMSQPGQINPLAGPPSMTQPTTVPPAIPIPRPNPWTDIGTAIDYFDAQNPYGLYPSTFPARPGVKPKVGVVGKDQSRLPGMNTGGFSGGGFGGGGGGGW